MKVKKLMVLLLVLMFIPVTTNALTLKELKDNSILFKKDKINIKNINVKGGECDQYVKYTFDEPIVGEEPKSSIKIEYKASHRETGEVKTFEFAVPVTWIELDSSYLDLMYNCEFNNDCNIQSKFNPMNGTFKKGKYYLPGTDEMDIFEGSEELEEYEFSCSPKYIINDIEFNIDDENAADLEFLFVSLINMIPIEKNNTVQIVDSSFVHLSNIEMFNLYDMENHPEELLHGEVNNLSVKLNLKFTEPGTYYKYLVKIHNGTNEDAEIQVGDLAKNSDYIDYTFEFLDGNNIAKAYSNKYLLVTATYKNAVPDELLENGYTEDNEIELKLGTDPLPDEKENNPKTGISTAIITIGITLAIVFAIIRFGIKKKIKYLAIFITTMVLFTPYAAKALKSVTLKVITNVEISYIVEEKPIDGGNPIRYKKDMTYTDWINSSFNTEHYLKCPSCDEITDEMVGKKALCPARANLTGFDEYLMDETNFTVETIEYCTITIQ